MLTTLGFDLVEQSMFRQLLEPITFPTKLSDSFTQAQLDNHIVDKHPGNEFAGEFSSAIGSSLLTHQIGLGLSSDWITDGQFMADIDTDSLFMVNDLTYPGIGGAWLYFTNGSYTWLQLTYSLTTGVKSVFWVDERQWVSVDWDILGNYLFTESDNLRVLNFNSVNTTDPTIRQSNLPDVFTEVVPGVYESNPAFVSGSDAIYPNGSNFSRNPLHYISADALDPYTEGLFDESIVDLTSIISHIQDSNIHFSLSDNILSTGKGYPSYYIRYALTPSQYLYNGFCGDAWVDDSGETQSPIIGQPTEAYWIAYGNNGGYVRHPDTNEVLVMPINDTTEVRCGFTLPPNIVPVADPGIVLRRLNPTVGSQPLTDLLAIP